MRGADRAYRRSWYRGFLDLMVNLYPGAAGVVCQEVKHVGCKDTNGIIVFAIENLDGDHVGGISLHSRDEKR